VTRSQNVRFGSFAEVDPADGGIRFARESRHPAGSAARQKSAKSGLARAMSGK
jgi:hypothetical protein